MESPLPSTGGCVTTDPFLGSSAPGELCNGRGTCVNGTRCVCSEMWTGRGDIFTAESFACVNPIVLDRGMWAALALAWSLMVLRALPQVAQHAHRYSRESADLRRQGRGATHDMKLAMQVHIGGVVSALFMITVALMRACTDQNLGVDLPVTIVMVLFYLSHPFASEAGSHLILKILIKSALKGEAERRMLAMDRRTGLTTAFLVSVGNSAVMVAGLFIPAVPSYTRIILSVLRQVLLAMTMIAAYARTRLTRYRLEEFRHAVHHGASGESSSSQTGLERAIEELRQQQRNIAGISVLTVALALVWIVTPQLYVVQSVYTVLLLAITVAARAHPAQYFMQASSKPSKSSGKATAPGELDTRAEGTLGPVHGSTVTSTSPAPVGSAAGTHVSVPRP